MEDVLAELDGLDERFSERRIRRAPAMPPRVATAPSLGRRRVCFRNGQTFAGPIARQLRGGMRKSTALRSANSPIRRKPPNTLSAPSLALSRAFISIDLCSDHK